MGILDPSTAFLLKTALLLGWGESSNIARLQPKKSQCSHSHTSTSTTHITWLCKLLDKLSYVNIFIAEYLIFALVSDYGGGHVNPTRYQTHIINPHNQLRMHKIMQNHLIKILNMQIE